jgi:release factor glutamine methyltransferase
MPNDVGTLLEAGPVCDARENRFRPSEYTALLIGAIRAHRHLVTGATALEIGCGSGVVLAALAEAGASRVCGVDIEPDAIAASRRLVADAGWSGVTELLQGDMWAPVAGRTFDVIVANLPHFPSDRPYLGDRLLSWTNGGPYGRDLLDRLLEGIGTHLNPGGCALITHGGTVCLRTTGDILAARQMTFRLVGGGLVMMSAEKLRSVTESLVQAERGRSILCYGPYTYNEVHVAHVTHDTSRA